MSLTLDPEVVYAILAAIVAIVLIVNLSRIFSRRTARQPYDSLTTEPKQQWPSVSDQ